MSLHLVLAVAPQGKDCIAPSAQRQAKPCSASLQNSQKVLELTPYPAAVRLQSPPKMGCSGASCASLVSHRASQLYHNPRASPCPLHTRPSGRSPGANSSSLWSQSSPHRGSPCSRPWHRVDNLGRGRLTGQGGLSGKRGLEKEGGREVKTHREVFSGMPGFSQFCRFLSNPESFSQAPLLGAEIPSCLRRLLGRGKVLQSRLISREASQMP